MSPTRTSAIALASLAITASAAAQCGYQSGTPQCFSFAPPPPEIGNISEDLMLRSDKLSLSGDIRFRTRNAQAPSNAPYNEADQVASRARVNLDYKFTERASAFVQFNFSEVWPGSEGYSDAVPGNDYNGVAQAYMRAEDLFGVGEVLRVGRSYYAVASGLIYGSCDFLQYPAAGTGAWLSKSFGEHSVELFSFDNNGTNTPAADGARYVGGTGRIDLGNEYVRALEPYVILGTGGGDVPNEDEWYGIAAHGSIRSAPDENSLFDWNAEYAQRQVEATDDSRDAYRVNILKDMTPYTHGLARLRFTRTDCEGAMHINPGDFNSAGLLHTYAGAWRSDLETNQFGVGFDLGERVNLDLAYLNLDAAGDSNNEIDAMAGAKLHSGVHAWVGYGRDEDDRQVLYAQLTLFF